MEHQNMLYINKSVTEEELIAGCRKKQQSSQKGLYDRYAPFMLAVCFRYIPDRQEAEHVMIGGFAKVFEKIGQFKGESILEGWIRRIIINECLMYIRKNKNMSVQTSIKDAEQVQDDWQADTYLGTHDLMKLIAKLPIGYRTVFNLYAIEGYSHTEISKITGITENNSKSQLYRARKWLQSKINEMENLNKITSHGTK